MAQTHAPDTAPAADLVRGAHIADPAPLGLAAFALTTFVLSAVNAGWVPASVEPVVFGLALAYGGVGQFAAGMWEFAKGNTFGATAFCSFGAFWVSFWWLAEHDLVGLGPEGYKAVGAYLLGWAIFTAYMSVAAIRVNTAVLTIFVLLTITFVVLAIGWFDQESSGWIKIGGYLGLLTAVAAWYASFAGVTASTFGRQILPVGARD
jgi:succinate-acetate transporter protein